MGKSRGGRREGMRTKARDIQAAAFANPARFGKGLGFSSAPHFREPMPLLPISTTLPWFIPTALAVVVSGLVLFSLWRQWWALRFQRDISHRSVQEKAELLVTPMARSLLKRCWTKQDVQRTFGPPQNPMSESKWVWSAAPEHLLPADRMPMAAELLGLPYDGVFLEFDGGGNLIHRGFRLVSRESGNTEG
jgi:hypothetical protein